MLRFSIRLWWGKKSSAKEIWKPWNQLKDLALQMWPLLGWCAYILSPTSSYIPHTYPAPQHAKSSAPPASESFFIYSAFSIGMPLPPSPLIDDHFWEAILLSADWDRMCVLISVFPQKCFPSTSSITSFVCMYMSEFLVKKNCSLFIFTYLVATHCWLIIHT